MKRSHSSVPVALFLACALPGHALAQNSVLSGWTFDTTAGVPNTPRVVSSNIGIVSGSSLYADGTNGSSSWVQASQLDALAGTTLNDPRFGATAGNAYTLVNGGAGANGQSVVFNLDTRGYSGISLSYATRGTDTGFDTQTWAYSTDGVNFTPVATIPGRTSTTYSGQTTGILPAAADNQSNLYVRLTVSGATAVGGNNRFDNVMITSADYTWFGAQGSDFSNPLNFAPGNLFPPLAAPGNGANVVFNDNALSQPSINSPTTLGRITYRTGTAPVVVGGSGAITLNSGVSNTSFFGLLVIDNPLLLNAPNVTISPTGGQIILGGNIGETGGSRALIVSGSGQTPLVLGGSNTYSGGTTITGGAGLFVTNASGSATGSGPVQVVAGTLGGPGTVTGPVTVAGGGIQAGGGPNSRLTVNTDLTFGNGTFLTAQVGNGTVANDTTASGGGRLVVGGQLGRSTLSSQLAVFLLSDGSLVTDGSVTYTRRVATYGSLLNLAENGGSGPGGAYVAADNAFSLSGFDFAIAPDWRINVSGGNMDVTFTPVPVPEPAAVLGIAAGALGVVSLLRRRLRSPRGEPHLAA